MVKRNIVGRAVRRTGQELADYSLIGGGLVGYHASRAAGRKEREVRLRPASGRAAAGPSTTAAWAVRAL